MPSVACPGRWCRWPAVGQHNRALPGYHQTMETTRTPLTPSQRVKRSNALLIERGGRRLPDAMLQPHEAQALAELVLAGYATTPLAAIRAAILDAHQKIKRT